MFYAPEILSQKNKTELSLVYYLSTTKNIKKTLKKEAVEVNINIVIDQIKNPSVPFALRLYSYLLNGIVKMWMIKVEYYKLQAKSMFIVRKKPVILQRKTLEQNVNLKVLDTYISEIEDYSNLSNDVLGSIEEILNNSSNNQATIKDDCNDYFFNDNELDIVSNNPIKKARKEVLDDEIELDPDSIFSKKIKCSTFESPNLITCATTSLFEQFLLKTYHKTSPCKNIVNTGIEQQFFEADFSVEDPRISSSASLDKNSFKPLSSDIDESNLKPHSSRALSFYNLLLSASQGDVTVYQRKPFDVIEIRTEDRVSYF